MYLHTLRKFICLALGIVGIHALAAVTTLAATPPVTANSTYRMDRRVVMQLESDGRAVYTVLAAPDGGFYAGGDFTMIAGQRRQNLAKFKADGSLDTSFNQSGSCDGAITSLAVQKNGHLFVGGSFTVFNGTPCHGIVSLNADGTLDPAFNVASGPNGLVQAIAVQADGRLLIAGAFTQINGVARGNIARLNANGSLDTSFDAGSNTGDEVNLIAIQSDGQILFGGIRYGYRGPTTSFLERTDANGTQDTSFRCYMSSSSYYCLFYALTVQSNGQILVGGDFSSYDMASDVTYDNLARLNADGSLDVSFKSDINSGIIVCALAVQLDGQILAAGINGQALGVSTQFVRLNTNGSLDSTFSIDSGFWRFEYGYPDSPKLALQADGRVVVAGTFEKLNGVAAVNLARLTETGALDTSFNSSAQRLAAPALVTALPGGKFLAGGDFTWVNDTACNRIARLNANGSLDTAFNPGSGFDAKVEVLAVQADGKMLVGGRFTTFNGTTRNRIARLNTNGTLDTRFNPGNAFDNDVTAITVQNDGKILVGGHVNDTNKSPIGKIVRLNANGTIDSTFTAQVGSIASIATIVVQADGRIFIGGDFSAADTTPKLSIARLNKNGTIDTSFKADIGDPSDQFACTVKTVTLLADGRSIVSGYWTASYGRGEDSYFIYRLKVNGERDTTFNPGEGFDYTINTVALQRDGRLVVGGDFTHFNTTACKKIVRLNTNGSLDTTFTIVGVTDRDYVTQIRALADGRLLVSGMIEFVNAGGSASNNGVVPRGPVVFKADN